MKDYQKRGDKKYLLPEAVYRQALWAVKDLLRLKEALREAVMMEDSLPGMVFGREERSGAYRSDVTGSKACRAAMLSMRIDSIEKAFSEIPVKYREGIRLKLTEGKAYSDDFHPNTWKKWQQIYIFHVARNLALY